MTNTDTYKQKLEEHLVQITSELKDLGIQNPKTGDWTEAPKEHQVEADQNTEADASEEQELREATLNNLEIEYHNIKLALQKITTGKFGVCEICGQPIETDRLDFNPAVRTCKVDMDKEGNLPL